MKPITKSALVGSVVLILVAPVFADFGGGAFKWNGVSLTTVGQVSLSSYPGDSNGGSFWVNLLSGSLPDTPYSTTIAPSNHIFTTYCIENNIFFNWDTSYWASIDVRAYSGNVSGNAGDPVSDVSEWIYDRWLAGNPDSWSQTDISRAIWWAEGEANGVKNSVADAALTSLGYGTLSKPLNYNGAQPLLDPSAHTWALNLWGDFVWNGTDWVAGDHQTQLITHNGTTNIPAPAASVLGLLGLGLVRRVSRRFR